MPALSPTNDHGRHYPRIVSLILALAACSSSTASIADFHSSTLHLAIHAIVVSRPLLLRIQFISYICRIFTGPLGDVQMWSHVSCSRSCLGLRAGTSATDQRYCIPSIHSENRDHRLKTTSSEQGECGNLIAASRQTRKEHCRSRRAHDILTPFLDFDSPPLLGFILSPPYTMSPVYGRGVIPVYVARQTCGETFLSLVVSQLSSGQTAASPWKAEISHQCRCRVADQLSGGETVAGKEYQGRKVQRKTDSGRGGRGSDVSFENATWIGPRADGLTG